MDKKKLAIFDLDGTLFDTGLVNYYSYRDALDSIGIKLDMDYFVKECNGKHYTQFLPLLNVSEEIMDAIHSKKKELYKTNLDKAIANDHLFSIIKSIKKEYYISIVTTASRENTVDILAYFNYQDLFDLIITQEDVQKVKPDPEGFIKAISFFDVDIKNTIIFEDSKSGIEAAMKTGAGVVKIERIEK